MLLRDLFINFKSFRPSEMQCRLYLVMFHLHVVCMMPYQTEERWTKGFSLTEHSPLVQAGDENASSILKEGH